MWGALGLKEEDQPAGKAMGLVEGSPQLGPGVGWPGLLLS